MPATTYKDLNAWQRAMELVVACYRVTKRFPADERFGLTSQLRRAAISVPSNIAEGSGRRNRRELLYFLSIARGSLKEVETLLHVAERLGYLTAEELSTPRELCDHVSRLLFGMRRRLEQ